MSEFLSSKDIKAVRKPHPCVWCGETIRVGEPATYVNSKEGGRLRTDYWHPECRSAYERSAICLYDDPFPEYGMERGQTGDE